MLFFLVMLLLLIELVFLAFRRDRRSVLLTFLSASTALFITGILIYIAKKGGISSETSFLLFGPDSLRRKLQYLVMTLGQLGYLVALGRCLTPFFLIITALDFCYFPLAIKLRRKSWLFAIPPLMTLVLYIPEVFGAFAKGGERSLAVAMAIPKIWIYGYIAAAVLILFHEFFSIKSSFFRRRFVTKMLILFSFALLFALFAGQDPAQIYLFYRNSYMINLGLWYLSAGHGTPLYIIVLAGSLLASVAGCVGTLRYFRVTIDEESEDVRLRRKAKDAAVGISMFIHGTKNELLSSRVLISRLERSGVVSDDLNQLKEINEKLIARMEKLHSSVRNEPQRLKPVSIEAVLEEALSIARKTNPAIIAIIETSSLGISVLADFSHLAEALSNIIVNGCEASKAPVSIEAHLERLWVSISISDTGPGITRDVQSRIWEPFYSTKNSSSNWGMGMYFMRNIIRMHMGSVRIESRIGKGTKFIILLPKYNG